MEGDLGEQEIFILMGFGIFIMLALASAFVLFFYRSQRRLLLQKVEGQEEMIQQTILAQEEERRRIASDLHDEIGSKLNVIHLYVHQLRKLKELDKLEDSVVDLTQIINTAIQTTRRISHELIPPTLEEIGFVEALNELCSSFSRTDTLEVFLEIDPNQKILSGSLEELNLFRIIQELINNSIKHGKASEIYIRFEPSNEGIVIHYRDNGGGTDQARLTKHKGLGMNNIESRLRMIKGQWTYSSAKGEGFKAEIKLKNNYETD